MLMYTTNVILIAFTQAFAPSTLIYELDMPPCHPSSQGSVSIAATRISSSVHGPLCAGHHFVE